MHACCKSNTEVWRSERLQGTGERPSGFDVGLNFEWACNVFLQSQDSAGDCWTDNHATLLPYIAFFRNKLSAIAYLDYIDCSLRPAEISQLQGICMISWCLLEIEHPYSCLDRGKWKDISKIPTDDHCRSRTDVQYQHHYSGCCMRLTVKCIYKFFNKVFAECLELG